MSRCDCHTADMSRCHRCHDVTLSQISRCHDVTLSQMSRDKSSWIPEIVPHQARNSSAKLASLPACRNSITKNWPAFRRASFASAQVSWGTFVDNYVRRGLGLPYIPHSEPRLLQVFRDRGVTKFCHDPFLECHNSRQFSENFVMTR